MYLPFSVVCVLFFSVEYGSFVFYNNYERYKCVTHTHKHTHTYTPATRGKKMQKQRNNNAQTIFKTVYKQMAYAK